MCHVLMWHVEKGVEMTKERKREGGGISISRIYICIKIKKL